MKFASLRGLMGIVLPIIPHLQLVGLFPMCYGLTKTLLAPSRGLYSGNPTPPYRTPVPRTWISTAGPSPSHSTAHPLATISSCKGRPALNSTRVPGPKCHWAAGKPRSLPSSPWCWLALGRWE